MSEVVETSRNVGRAMHDRDEQVAVRRGWMVAALVVGPAFNLVEALLPRAVGLRVADLASAEALVSSMAEHSDLLLWERTVGLVGAFLLLPAFLAAFGLLQAAAPRAARIGRRLALVGVPGFVGLQVVELARYLAAAQGPETVAFQEALLAHPALVLVLLPFLVGMFGALLSLAVGLWRSRIVHRVVPVLLVAFAVADLGIEGVGMLEPHWLFFVGMAALAWRASRVPAASDAHAPPDRAVDDVRLT